MTSLEDSRGEAIMSRPIARTRSSTSSAMKVQTGASFIFNQPINQSATTTPMYSTVSSTMTNCGHDQISVSDSVSYVPPPCSPVVTYYCSRKASNHICYIYRVVKKCKGRRNFKCMPEAQRWPEMHLTAEELQKHFLKLDENTIFSNSSQEMHGVSRGEPLFPSLADLKKWQVGAAVCFNHYDVRTTGLVVGRFAWEEGRMPSATNRKTLTLVLLLQTPTNKLLLSSEVTDLEIEDMEAMATRSEVYIQGISLLAIVATLIANVTYLGMVNPPKGKNDSPEVLGVLPVTFTFFNAIAFYCSVLAVVVMTAFIPIFGTARQWGAIFLSGSIPVVVGLISFYIAFIISAWAVMDFWVKPLAITLLGVSMVLYVYIWAVQLMRGHIEKDLRIQRNITPWDWYVNRSRHGRPPHALNRFAQRLRFVSLSIDNIFTSREKQSSSLARAIVMSRSREQQAYLLGE